MPQEEPKEIGALLEELKQKPGYSDPRVKAVLDEEIPKLVAQHKANNEEGLLQALGEIQRKVDGILKPVPAGPPPPATVVLPPAVEPPAAEPPEGPDPDVPALDITVKESFDGMTDAEVINNLKAQYEERLVTLTYFNIVEDVNIIPNLGYLSVRDINGDLKPVPSFFKIQSLLLKPEFLQKIRQFKRPMLLVTPIGMSLKELARRIGKKCGRLETHNPVNFTWNLDSDKTGELVYFPELYDKGNHGGITKAELLAQTGGNNIFAGWQVTVVEGMDEVDLEAIKINPPPTDPNASKYKNAHQFLREMQTAGISGLTLEEWLVLHAEGVRRGKPFESEYWTWLLAAYHKALGAVPYSYFDPGDADAFVDRGAPGVSDNVLGVRRAARG